MEIMLKATVHAGLNLEKVEIVLMQQTSGPASPAPAPAPAAPAPLAEKIIGLPVTPAVPPSSSPTIAPVQQSAAGTGSSTDSKKTIIIAVVCVVGAAGEQRAACRTMSHNGCVSFWVCAHFSFTMCCLLMLTYVCGVCRCVCLTRRVGRLVVPGSAEQEGGEELCQEA